MGKGVQRPWGMAEVQEEAGLGERVSLGKGVWGGRQLTGSPGA